MDKKLMLAVAGAGKTTHIINNLSATKRTLIVTYTIGNYNNLLQKISAKFNGEWPENITVMKYFSFLYSFCYKPFLADRIRAKGIIYENNPNQFAKQSERKYYLSKDGYFYSNRLSLFLEKAHTIPLIKARLETYFDEFIIDEVQDIAGRDFLFLEQLMSANINMLFVGDFFQHTFDTSRDGNVNSNLFDNQNTYITRYTSKGIVCDRTTLISSYRCSQNVCRFINNMLGISMASNRTETDNTEISFVSEAAECSRILADPQIIKLHYQNGHRYGSGHKNWGETKGEDCYGDVCVLLNKNTARKHAAGKLSELPASTRNKLYVAITRAHGNVYFINE